MTQTGLTYLYIYTYTFGNIMNLISSLILISIYVSYVTTEYLKQFFSAWIILHPMMKSDDSQIKYRSIGLNYRANDNHLHRSPFFQLIISTFINFPSPSPRLIPRTFTKRRGLKQPFAQIIEQPLRYMQSSTCACAAGEARPKTIVITHARVPG